MRSLTRTCSLTSSTSLLDELLRDAHVLHATPQYLCVCVYVCVCARTYACMYTRVRIYMCTTRIRIYAHKLLDGAHILYTTPQYRLLDRSGCRSVNAV